MVSPVTGPFTTIYLSPDGAKYSYKKGYKQAKPYTLPLEYEMRVSESHASGMAPDAISVGAYDWLTYEETSQFDWDPIIDKAYQRLRDKLVGEQAGMAVNLAEYNQALASMTSRFMQLRNAWVALRRWDLPQVAKTLKVPVQPPKGVSKRKAVASNWLEYSFGWKPLVQDIYTSVDVLQSPLENKSAKASASDSGVTDLAAPTSGGDPNSFWPGLLSYSSYNKMQYSRRVSMGAQIRINNPNLFLANQLGLVNPATIAWELVPFSFVVDWFANVGDFLNSGTDFIGCSLTGEWTTRTFKLTQHQESRSTYRWVEHDSYMFGGTYRSRSTVGSQARRQLGLQRPGLYIRPAKLWGWERCANALSVLTQLFAKR